MLGDNDGLKLGLTDGLSDGDKLGETETDGEIDGDILGLIEGDNEGLTDGDNEGLIDKDILELMLGLSTKIQPGFPPLSVFVPSKASILTPAVASELVTEV